VAAPVLAAATLDTHQWQVVHRVADDETRRFIETLHPEVRTEPQPAPAKLPPTADEVPETPYVPPSLHEVVERIERRRQLRSVEPAGTVSELAAPEEPPALFRWECGPGGEIAWVEGAPRGPLIGRSIVRLQDSDGDRIGQEVIRAFAARAPFRDGALTVASAGSVSGDWKISGVPAFEAADGRFAGYRGIALREATPPVAEPSSQVPDVLTDPASLRELVHEIKTPLNAIMGFAEIIEGQYLGPADRGYRERAGEIVRQAQLLLRAIDDLDFAAKVHSASGATHERVDLGALVGRTLGELREIARRRGAEADLLQPRRAVAAAVQPELADRLLLRLFDALADAAAAGEQLQVSVEAAGGKARIAITRPSVLRGLGDSELFGIAPTGAGAPGAFSLRLARGLARIAGGDLVSSRDSLALVFPSP
jgi:hypothetical protein